MMHVKIQTWRIKANYFRQVSLSQDFPLVFNYIVSDIYTEHEGKKLEHKTQRNYNNLATHRGNDTN